MASEQLTAIAQQEIAEFSREGKILEELFFLLRNSETAIDLAEVFNRCLCLLRKIDRFKSLSNSFALSEGTVKIVLPLAFFPGSLSELKKKHGCSRI